MSRANPIQKLMRNISVLFALAVMLAATPAIHADKVDLSKVDVSKLPPAANRQGVTYAKDIRPLFQASCFGCHGQEKHKGDLRLDSLESVLKGSEHGKVIVPGSSKQSLLVVAVAQIHDDLVMPPKRKAGPGGPGGPGAGRPNSRPPGASGANPPTGPQGGRPPGGPGGGAPPKPLTAEQVGLVRAWVDQGAK